MYDAYRQRLFRLALVLGRGDETLAQDVVQSVFVTAARKLRSVDSEDHLWNWLARVARQHIAKHFRKQRQESAAVNFAELPEFADDAASDETLEKCLDAAVLAMDAEERQLIERFYFDQLSQKEIAEQLNISPKAVSSRLERAREKLRLLVTRNLSHET